MTGTVGFSISGNHSVKLNPNLAKIHPNPSISSQFDYNSKKGLIDKKSLNQAIKLRIERK